MTDAPRLPDTATPLRVAGMSPFARIVAKQQPAPGTEVVSPWAFKADFDGKPDAPVCFGLRPLSNADIEFCDGEAREHLREMHDISETSSELEIDAAVQTYNAMLMRLAVARGTCDPNDARKSHPIWRGMADDLVHDALTAEGVKVLFDALERVTIATSPVRREITADELAELATTMAPHALEMLPEWQARRIRRLLAWCVDEVRDSKK